MYLYRSNRAENLIDALAKLLREHPQSALTAESIVVQSRGMERWVSMELSKRLGIWANGKFPFPRGWLEDVITRVLGVDTITDTPHDAYDPASMQWSIAALLPELLTRPEFAPVAAYLADPGDTQRLLELSRELATLFDQYLVFRPAWIQQWRIEPTDDWQAILWRELEARHGPHHGAARTLELHAQLRSTAFNPQVLPKRVILFAVSTLPPLYVDMLSALAEHMDVHWFLLSPSREYYADIRPERDVLRAQPDRGPSQRDDLHLTVGQSLLASWGLVGRELHTLIDDRCQNVHDDQDLYVDPGTSTLLHTLQSDMLNLRDRRVTDAASQTADSCEALPLSDDDASLSIHACHSEMREVEVLHDQILDLLERDPTLSPQDVLVMAPDIDRYAPLIDAVFSSHDALGAIPYHVSERKLSSSRPVLEAFDALLAVLSSRFGASDVLDLLSMDLVRGRFGLDDDGLATATDWIHEAGVRWAIDEAHRSEEHQPALRENTWGFGLDRLMLGYAMDGHGQHLAYGVLPYDGMEGSHTDVLGKLADYCQTLFRLRERMRVDHTIADWKDVLTDALHAMIDADPHGAGDHRRITQALHAMAEHAAAAGFTQTLSLSAVRRELGVCLERGAGSPGFLSAGVTFCRMVPMRSIPFRVIALLGMGATGFPRSTRPSGLDRMQSKRQVGDRTARDDDRQLLLEVLLSVRDRLIVTYIGQGIRDNKPLPPSVLVDELLDWCGQAFTQPAPAAARSMRDRLVVQHPLQPWSPRYFGASNDPRWFSYRQDHAEGSLALQRAAPQPQRLFASPIAHAVPAESITTRELEDAILLPARQLLRERLRLRLDDADITIDDREPMALDPLTEHLIAEPALASALRGERHDDAAALLRASGQLPLGTPGAIKTDKLLESVRALADACAPWMQDRMDPLPLELDFDGLRLTGVLRDRYGAGQLHVTYSKLDGRALVRAWIRHLVLHAAHSDRVTTRVVGRAHDGATSKVLAPLTTDEARAHLRTLIELRAQTLEKPIPFDAKRGYAYATKLGETRDRDVAIQAAISAGGAFGPDQHVLLAFDGADPLGLPEQHAAFAEFARAVFDPLIAHLGDDA